jgi:hypothetical protein
MLQSLSQASPVAVALGIKFGALDGLPQLLRMAAPMAARIGGFTTSSVRRPPSCRPPSRRPPSRDACRL